MSNIEEHVMAEERGRTYGFLSSLFLKPPADPVVSMIKSGDILAAFQSGEESKGYAELVRFVKEAAAIADLKDELEAEHTSLFVLPSGVIPHEAAYLDKEKRLGARVTIAVRQFYERAGADVLDTCIEMPDHMGMELEFMGLLCKLEKGLREGSDQSALEGCIKSQKNFLDEHLSKWVYQCCEKIIGKATYGFYKAIAHFTIDFMKREEEYVSDLYLKFRKEGEELCETVI